MSRVIVGFAVFALAVGAGIALNVTARPRVSDGSLPPPPCVVDALARLTQDLHALD